MAKAVGLDLGMRSIKIAELEGSPKKYRIVRYTEQELPPARDTEARTAAVAEIVRSRKIGRDAVITALPTDSVTIREILVPFKNEDQIRKIVKFEAETHLHATAIEDVVVEYFPVAETKEGTRLLILAAPKAELRARLDLLKKAGIDPRAVDLDSVALFNAVSAAGLAAEDKSVVVVDIGASSTKILLIRDGQLRTVRALRMGTDSIVRQLEGDLGVPFDEAETRQLAAGGPEGGNLMVPASAVEAPEDLPETARSASQLEIAVVLDRRRSFLDRASRELTRSMAALSADSRIDAFYVTGGGSRSPEVVAELSQRFGVDVEPLDLLEHLPHSLVEADPDAVNASGAVAIGLALKQLGASRIEIDFRQEEFAFARKFEIIKLALAVGVSFVFILVFLYFLFLQRQITTQDYQYRYYYEPTARQQFEESVKSYQRALEGQAKDHTPRKLGDLREVESYQKALLGIHDELVNELGINPDIPPIRSALQVLREFFERIQPDRETKIDYLYVNSIVLSTTSLRVKGEIGSIPDIGVLRRRFTDDPLFVAFDSKTQQPTKEGRTTLDVELRLAEPEGAPSSRRPR